MSKMCFDQFRINLQIIARMVSEVFDDFSRYQSGFHSGANSFATLGISQPGRITDQQHAFAEKLRMHAIKQLIRMAMKFPRKRSNDFATLAKKTGEIIDMMRQTFRANSTETDVQE